MQTTRATRHAPVHKFFYSTRPSILSLTPGTPQQRKARQCFRLAGTLLDQHNTMTHVSTDGRRLQTTRSR